MTKYLIYTFFVVLIFVSCRNTQNLAKVEAKSDVRDEAIFIEGVRQRLLGNGDDALGYFRAYLAKFPQSAASYYNLGMIYFDDSEYDFAFKNALEAIKISPNNIAYNLLYIDCAIQTQHINKAFDSYDKILKIQPDNPDNWLEYMDLLAQFKVYNKAISIAHRFENQFGVSIFSLRYKYEIFAGLNKVDSVEQTLMSLHQLSPKDVKYGGMLAEFYIGQKKYDKAQKLYDKFLQIPIPKGAIYLSMANFERIKGNKNKEVEYFISALPDTTLQFDKKLKFFRLMRSKQEFTDSILYGQLLAQMISAYPNEAALLLIQAKYLYKETEYERVIPILKKIVDLAPGNFNTWLLLLDAEYRMNNYEELYDDANRALELFPNQANFYLVSGIGALRSDRDKEAASILKSGLDYVFDNPALEFQFDSYLGEAYNNLRNYEKSDYYFNHAIILDSTNFVLKNNYAYYLSLRAEHLQKAENLIKASLEAEPDNYVYQDTYAWILYKMKNFEQALIWEKKALKNKTKIYGDDDIDLLEHYLAIIKALGHDQDLEKIEKRIQKLKKN